MPYLDHAAATPTIAEALEAQAAASRQWPANPSAAHAAGRAARAELERLRAGLSRLCGFQGGRLVVMSGATEANNSVIHSLSFRGLNGSALCADLSLQGFDVAAGSACAGDRPEPSRTILALGRPADVALGTIRISFGPGNTEDEARSLAAAIAAAVRRQRMENHA